MKLLTKIKRFFGYYNYRFVEISTKESSSKSGIEKVSMITIFDGNEKCNKYFFQTEDDWQDTWFDYAGKPLGYDEDIEIELAIRRHNQDLENKKRKALIENIL